MVVFRVLGWLLLAMAVAAVVHDGLAWSTDGTFRLLGLGDLWSHLDVRSLNGAQNAVQGFLSVSLWNWLVQPLLMVPSLLAFLVLGFIFLWLGARAGRSVETGLFVGSRPPRRRRSRGL
ncbi:MAG: hypothetical protein K9G48_06575 [Reyranella sp.]|nr:hypothetical protein [Reyranella sp.]